MFAPVDLLVSFVVCFVVSFGAMLVRSHALR